MKRILSTRRLIPLDRLDDYLLDWERVRAAVESAGGRAWLFRGARHQDQFIEFVEWGEEVGDTPLPERADVAPARLQLDEAYGRGHADDWEEAARGREAT
jgi:hypothetical protein